MLKLMIPGPVDVADDVRQAMESPTIPHYGEAWVALYREVIGNLKQIHGTEQELYLLLGSGTAGLDAALGSALYRDEKVLIPTNGFFGDRLLSVARCLGLHPVTLEFSPGRPVDPDAIRERLVEDRDIRLMAIVHHETSTGVLNPLEEIAEVSHSLGVPILVDAVSSLGGVPLPVDEWKLDLVVSVTNKCLGAPPGFASIVVSPTAVLMMENRPDRGRSWYLSIETWRHYAEAWADWHPQPVTMPGQNLLAVATALRRIVARGLDKHFEDLARAARSVRAGMSSLGFELFVDLAYACPALSAFKALPGTSSAELVRFLLEEHNIQIAQGIGEMKDDIFRIGHMGMATSDEYVQALLAGAAAYLQQGDCLTSCAPVL